MRQLLPQTEEQSLISVEYSVRRGIMTLQINYFQQRPLQIPDVRSNCLGKGCYTQYCKRSGGDGAGKLLWTKFSSRAAETKVPVD